MRRALLIFCMTGLAWLIHSCTKEDNKPYIIFKDSNANVLNTDTLEVNINTVQELLIESGFPGSSPLYLRQIDEGEVVDISETADVQRVTTGSSGINIEKVVITTHVNDAIVVSGSIIKTTVRINTDLSESKYYKVR